MYCRGARRAILFHVGVGVETAGCTHQRLLAEVVEIAVDREKLLFLRPADHGGLFFVGQTEKKVSGRVTYLGNFGEDIRLRVMRSNLRKKALARLLF